MKKYGVFNSEESCWSFACCGYGKVENTDKDGYFGTDDVNIAYRCAEHFDNTKFIVREKQ